MSKGGKGGGSQQPSGTTTTTQTSSPWEGLQPYLTGSGIVPQAGTGYLPEAANLYYNYSPSYFPTSTAAPMNPTQNAATIAQANFGLAGGDSALNSANSALTGINSGAFLGPNPYLKQTTQAISDAIMPQVNSQFNSAGRYGSGANQYAASSAIANAVAPLEFNDYEQQVGNILKGSQIAPVVSLGQQGALDEALNAGNTVQQNQQNQLNDAVNRFNFYQELPYQKLNQYQGNLSGLGGGTSTLTQPYFAQQSGKGGKGGVGGTIAAVAPYIAKAALAL